LSRDVRRAAPLIGDYAKIFEWDGRSTGTWISQADGAYAIINLAGENISQGRWNQSKKAGILHSRLDATRAVVAAIKLIGNKPSVVVQASAIGYYGSSRTEEFNENSQPGKGFLADVCKKVELCTEPIEGLGVRLVIIRTGVVLGRDGGALPNLVKPFKMFFGGHPGSGRQWFSWISLEDQVAAIRFLLENEKQRGVFNLTAPEPVTMKGFCKTLGKVLKRPSLLFVPGFVLRLMLGEMADEMILSGQKVVPEKLVNAGFHFKYTKVEDALKAILS